MEEFPRIKRLPPYVFNVTGELKLAARRRGEDVIDFSMGTQGSPAILMFGDGKKFPATFLSESVGFSAGVQNAATYGFMRSHDNRFYRVES